MIAKRCVNTRLMMSNVSLSFVLAIHFGGQSPPSNNRNNILVSCATRALFERRGGFSENLDDAYIGRIFVGATTGNVGNGFLNI